MFSSITFWVSNSKQVAMYFVSQFGFTIIDYQGLEHGYTSTDTYTLKSNDIIFIIKACIIPDHNCLIARHLAVHGDSVKDVAFKVNDCDYVYTRAIERGGVSVSKPHIKNGYKMATIKTLTDITHTFVEGDEYKQTVPFHQLNSINRVLPPTMLVKIDHVVTNSPHMEPLVKWYEHILEFHRYWSVDETQIHTKYSALRSIVVANEDETVKMPINEPVEGVGKKESQIQEYINFHGGSGVQHIALLTHDIIETVYALKQRGVEFLSIPQSYYDNLKSRLLMSKVVIESDLELVSKYNILVDFDEDGYLLQIFTKPITSRPTLFIEIIERHNFDGFGAGNFKALFESIEIEQAKRKQLI
jgi:4-hydroxyphenylpyruvate dioxygenase